MAYVKFRVQMPPGGSARKDANVKITDLPLIQRLRHQANGAEGLPNLMFYESALSLTSASSSAFAHKSYVDTQVLAGCADATESVEGCIELATAAEAAAGPFNP